ncbi:MAG: alpha-mannosidase [Trueperaceae bacterium]|nr:alpha-mannosidase [Trueperaceae bacterium]
MNHDIRWTTDKIKHRLELIQPLIYKKRLALEPFSYIALDNPKTEPPFGADTTTWEKIPWNSYWGNWFTDFALASTFKIPDEWGNESITLHLPLGEAGDFSHPEVLVYVDEQIISACDRHHQELFLPNNFTDGKIHKLFLHGWTGLGGFANGQEQSKLFMHECAVVQIDKDLREFVTAAKITLGVVNELSNNDPVRGNLLNALNNAFNKLDTRAPLSDYLYASVADAYSVLKKGIEQSGSPLAVNIIAVGHAHIDVAWLWTLDQTRRKAGRSFSTALKLMEEFPDYHFSQSQPQLYQYTEETYPELFEGIKDRVAEGRWELMGGTWVEPDCNAIGAESLARQFLLGINYFREKFGQAGTPVLWLPDTFGYAWGLPQLIKEAGFKYFVTHKMSWNQYNQMPFQSLWWQGLDGTKVLTHFLTTPETNWGGLEFSTTYNGDLSPKQVTKTWDIYKQKETHNELITAYGYGDGGGGPTREILEGLGYMKDHPGLPKVRSGTVKTFLEGLESRSSSLPTWNGEFYLEYHRGTYTSQARTKRNNRKNEFLLHDAEFLAAWASLATDFEYPKQDLKHAWELVCLNQFHDILPGSSIGLVYQDSERDHAEVRQVAQEVRDTALKCLAEMVPSDYLAVNPTSFFGSSFALLPEVLPEEKTLSQNGIAVTKQIVEEGTLIELADLEPYSLTPLALVEVTDSETKDLFITKDASGVILENSLLRIEFNLTGDITRIFDKALLREVLAENARANVFQVFEDRPLQFDAWDIDIFYDDKQWEAEPAHHLEIVEVGPLRAGVNIKRRIMNSEVSQRIYLYHNSYRLDFETTLDWHDQHILLKVAFPVNILNIKATYDIQWGNVERPTHRNTSWDWGRFETCAYKWVDLSEGNYGVSLLNDCKHGHDVQENVMRLTLLKSATSPDENADQGLHQVSYSLFPHQGDWREGTVKESYHLNNPVLLRSNPNQGKSKAQYLVKVDAPNVVIETVKRAEDGDGLIVRLYENERCHSSINLQTGFDLAKAYRCNLLEEIQEPLELLGNAVKLQLRPYQIMTLRLIARGALSE